VSRSAEIESAKDTVRHRGGSPHDLALQLILPWKQEFAGLNTDQVKRLKELEQKNVRLRCAVSHLTLDRLILAEGLPRETRRSPCRNLSILGGNFRSPCVVPVRRSDSIA